MCMKALLRQLSGHGVDDIQLPIRDFKRGSNTLHNRVNVSTILIDWKGDIKRASTRAKKEWSNGNEAETIVPGNPKASERTSKRSNTVLFAKSYINPMNLSPTFWLFKLYVLT